MADVSQIVLKDANGNVIGTYDVKDTNVPHDSKTAESGGTTLSLVTTGEKAIWNAKSDTDTKVTQSLSSTNAHYPILFSYAGNADTTANVTNICHRNNSVAINPSTGNIMTTQLNGVTIGHSPKFTDTTYTFANGTNGFTVTPSGGSAQTVTVTPSITNNITGSGSANYLAKFTAANTIGQGPAQTTSVTSGSSALVTSGGVYNAFTSRIKRTQNTRYFNAKTTMSYTGLSLTCPSGHVYVVQAWFRYAQSAPRRVGASHANGTVFPFYDNVAASLDTYDCGHGSITFMMYPGETIYYWAMYYDAKQNFITENILDITL